MKQYTIIAKRPGGEYSASGTVAELVEKFEYTLICGRCKIHHPTINALIKALNESAAACHRYNDYYTLKTF